MNRRALAVFLLIAGCGGVPIEEVDAGTFTDAGGTMDAGVSADAGGTVDAGTPTDAGLPTDAGMPTDAGPTCPSGRICVTQFPFTNTNDSAASALSAFNKYSCALSSDESGPEVVYQVTVPSAGFLSAAVYEQAGVDVDVHLLSSLDAGACLSRGSLQAKADVAPGTYFVVVDSFVSGGVSKGGAYRVDIGFVKPSVGACAMNTGLMSRVNDMGNALAMPATGQMAVEAHLVTKEEPPPYPTTATEHLEAHGALSQARTGFVMHRTQVWAPLEGGTFYGAGIGSPTLFPVEDEGWYINMYWTSAARPARGTKMIARSADGGTRAVVVAAGYETGPGNLSFVGGTPEETHFYMGTGHGSAMTIGIATDQTLPFGPRDCVP